MFGLRQNAFTAFALVVIAGAGWADNKTTGLNDSGITAMHHRLRACDPDNPTTCGDDEYCRVPRGKCDHADARGYCARRPTECSDVYLPVCGCDGVTYGNRCEAASAGVSVRHGGPCRVRCDRSNPGICGADHYCRFPMGTCRSDDVVGECAPIPSECPDVFEPVCGCDGMTYGNRCEAAMAGVSIAYRGPCVQHCDRAGEHPCDAGEFCMFPPGTCRMEDIRGICTTIPTGCPDVYEPVCGCDGMTYGNRCEAAMAGVSIAHRGACVRRCDRTGEHPCDEGQFCMFQPGMCDAEDAVGMCTSIPEVCRDIYEPVCGCDGMTYGNHCEAAMAGVSIAHRGACVRVCGGIAGDPCEVGEFCKFRMGTCDFADQQGVCRPIPTECRRIFMPVCGCDGNTYLNECLADRAGVSVDHFGPCRD